MLEEKIKKEFAAKPSKARSSAKSEPKNLKSSPSSRTLRVHYGVNFSLPLLGEAGPAQIPSGLCGVNSRGLRGIFTPHFERSEIVAGPPAEPVNEIGSDIFKYIPPVGKSSCWLARYAGSPPDFERKIEFFVFVPQSGTPEAGFSKLKL